MGKTEGGFSWVTEGENQRYHLRWRFFLFLCVAFFSSFFLICRFLLFSFFSFFPFTSFRVGYTPRLLRYYMLGLLSTFLISKSPFTILSYSTRLAIDRFSTHVLIIQSVILVVRPIKAKCCVCFASSLAQSFPRAATPTQGTIFNSSFIYNLIILPDVVVWHFSLFRHFLSLPYICTLTVLIYPSSIVYDKKQEMSKNGDILLTTSLEMLA